MWNFNGTKIFASKMWIPEKLFESNNYLLRNNIVLILISISGPGICIYICVCEEQKIDSANFTIYNILEFFKYRLKNDKFLTWIFLKKLVSISILILMIIVECDTFFFTMYGVGDETYFSLFILIKVMNVSSFYILHAQLRPCIVCSKMSLVSIFLIQPRRWGEA